MTKLRELLIANLTKERGDIMETKYAEIILDKLENEIKQEVIIEEAKAFQDAKDKEETLRNIEKLQDMFWTVVIIGVLVGVTGNQITECISALKGNAGILFTLGLAALLILVMYGYFSIRYIRQATNEIKNFREKKDND